MNRKQTLLIILIIHLMIFMRETWGEIKKKEKILNGCDYCIYIEGNVIGSVMLFVVLMIM